MTKTQYSQLKAGDILIPNGGSKQSCYHKLQNLKVVKFLHRLDYGKEISVEIVKGYTTNSTTWQDSYNKGERITVNGSHFRLANDHKSDRLYDICG